MMLFKRCLQIPISLILLASLTWSLLPSPLIASTSVSFTFSQNADLPHEDIADLRGVISGPTQPVNSPAPDLTQKLQEVGIRLIRNNDYYDDRLDIEGIFNCGGDTYPSWEGCDATDEQFYFWDKSDALMGAIVNGGFESFLRLGGEWQNADPTHDFKGPQNDTQETNWIIAAKKVAERYEPHYTYLNIWTEYPGGNFWDRTNSEFNSFWLEAYQAIKADFPDKKVGGPGFSPLVTTEIMSGDTSNAATTFLTKLYRAGAKPDWIGWHLFSVNPKDYQEADTAYRHLLDGTGPYSGMPWAGKEHFANTQLIVDAWGTAEREQDDSGSLEGISEEELAAIHNGGLGAALLGSTWIALQTTETPLAFYYRAGDGTSTPGAEGKAGGWVGLFHGDATATTKPSANGIRFWTRLTEDYPNLIDVSEPDEHGNENVWSLLASDDHGARALFVTNMSDESVTWTATLDAEADVDTDAVTIYTVDDTNDGTTGVATSGLSHTIAAQSAQFIIFEAAQEEEEPTETPSESGGGGGGTQEPEDSEETDDTTTETPDDDEDEPISVIDIDPVPEPVVEPATDMPDTGDLVKLPDDGDVTTSVDSAVYYIGGDGKRHPFPNEAVYKSWFSGFDDVYELSADTMSDLTIGSLILSRPGTALVKIQSDPKVYAVEPGYILRWITTEEIAKTLFGDGWARRVMDIEPTFFTHFTVGDSIGTAEYPDGTLIHSSTDATIWRIKEGLRRPFGSTQAFEDNSFQTRSVLTSDTGWSSIPIGTTINGYEAGLTDEELVP